MAKKIICLLVAVSAIGAASLFGQGGPNKVEGTLTLNKKTYTPKQVVAYETTIDNEDAIEVVLSGQAVTSEEITAARKAEKDGSDGEFTKRPYLRLVFK